MKFRWDKKYLYTGVTAFCVIVACLLLIWVVMSWDNIWASLGKVARMLAPVFYGIGIAYVLWPICQFFERTCFTKLGKKMAKTPVGAKKAARAFSATTALLIALILFGVLLYLILPQLLQSVKTLIQRANGYVQSATDWLDRLLHGQELETRIANILQGVYKAGSDWLENTLLPRMDSVLVDVSLGIVSVLKTLANWIMGIVIAVYLLYNKELFVAQIKKVLFCVLPARPVNSLIRNAALTHKMFGGFLIAKLIDSAIVAVICYLFLLIFGMPYAVLIAVIIGVTNIIPFFGPFIGAIPSALLLLLESPWKCLWFLIFLLALQQLDGSILGPRLMGTTTGLNGFWVMVALLLGGGFFGFLGMVCGVPLFAVLYTLIRTATEGRLRKKRLPVSTEDYHGLKAIDPATLEPLYRQAAAGRSGANSARQ